MTILVTGATGHLGHLVIDALIDRGVAADSIVAGARDTAKASDLTARGVRAVHLDYTDPSSISAALDGVDSVLLISGSEVGSRTAQHQNVIDAAKAAGVTKFVYTSVTKATTTDLVLAPEHKATEEAIAAAGLPAVILRNNWYSENYGRNIPAAKETGYLDASVGAGRVASASRKDFAEAAAVVLTEDGHIGEVYELGGDEAWNYHELASTIGELIDAKVEYRALSTEDFAEELRGKGVDEGTIGFQTALDTGIKEGDLSYTDGTLSRLIGRPTTPLKEGLRPLA